MDNERSSPPDPRRLAKLGDLVGLTAFYPLFSVVGYLAGSLVLLLSSRVYLIVLLAAMAHATWALSWPRPGRARAAGALFGASAAALAAELLAPQGNLASALGSVGEVLPMAVIGLLAHDVAKATPIGSKLDRLGGLTVLGSFLVVIREPVTVLLGLVLMTLGLGGISQHLRNLASRFR
ncbi:MAG: hypothetical protein QI223_06710 [Candidatus Korarchaeota archaeon]|nr:hypothetical protein [Candidatus Korarchaeota archaeon]